MKKARSRIGVNIMTGESNEESTVVTEPSNEQATEVATVTALQNDVAELKAQLEKQIPLIDKLREHEQSSLKREQEALADQDKKIREGVEGELDALEQKFNLKLENVLIDAALEKELTLAGARNVDVAKKLLDRQTIDVVDGKANLTAIQTTIASLKETDSYMFKSDEEVKTTTLKPAATPVARAGEPENVDIVNKELRAATTQAELQAVMKKHNVKT